MSASEKDRTEGPKRPPESTSRHVETPLSRPDSPSSPASKRMREKVSFFEKVWTGSKSGRVGDEVAGDIDVSEIEKRLEEEKARHLEPRPLEQVTLRHTGFPKHVVHTKEVGPDGTLKAGIPFFLIYVQQNKISGIIAVWERILKFASDS